MEHALVIDKMPLIAQTHHAQDGRDRSLFTRRDGAGHQHLNVRPGLGRDVHGEQDQDVVIFVVQSEPR
jgi:hypothetical protein